MARLSSSGNGGAAASEFTKITLITGGDAVSSPTTTATFTTIQAALNAIPTGTTSTNIRKVYTILIPQGTYDEDLTIDITNCHIQLLALGPVNLGLFNNTFWAASNSRSITINCTSSGIDSIRPTLGIGTYIPYGTNQTTHPSYSTGFRISGNITWNVTSISFTNAELYLDAEVFGNVDSSISVTHNFHLYFTRARVRGTVPGTRNLIQLADWCVFTGLVTCQTYSTIRHSVFSGGMTVSSAAGGGVKPFGMFASDFFGTFTGPALSFAIDNSTDYYFTLNSGVLAGGATKTFIDASGSGITQLTGDVTAGPGSGSVASTLANAVVTNAKLSTMAANTVKANITSGTAAPTDVALLTTATNNSVAQRTSSGDLIANIMIAPAMKPADGAGTSITVTGGTAASNGNGGNASLIGAAGSSVSTGGNGGNITLTGGAANGDNTTNQSGGSITFNAGTSKGSSQGGGLTINLGTGGPGTATAGATGGTNNINAGTGGIGSATSGTGGNTTLNAGTGGAGTVGGGGGTATLHGGNGGTGSTSGGNGGAANVTGGSASNNANSSGGSVSLSAAGGSSTGAGGAGGTATITGGAAGGDNTQNNNGGSVTITAGNSKGSASGSNVNVTAGTGGIGTGTAGANGGAIQITGGSAGAGSATGGIGGTVQITGGNSGASASSNGGQIILAGAVGSSTGVGGAGGNAQLNGGNANGDNTQSNVGGNVTLTSGNSKGSAVGGSINLNLGTGGIGTGTAGAAGGAFTLVCGAGGVGSSTGGAGGSINIRAGLGGNSGTPGAGGEIIFQTAATTSLAEHLRIKNTGDIVVTAGNLQLATIGNGLQVKTGTNSKLGTVTLVAGNATVANTSVTTNSRIFLTSQSDGGVIGFLRITAKTAGTSFVISSSSLLDTSVVAWMIVESIP